MIYSKKTKGEKMFRLTLVFTIILAFTSCSQDTILLNSIEKPPKVKIKKISKISIPVREHGYNNFETMLLTSQTELNKFISKIKLQKSWNKQENFLESLLLKKINFSNSNILLYRITESSSSTILLVEPPSGDNKHIQIVIGKNKPKIGTSDMAHYALAYRVSKSVIDITFKYGTKKDVIKNSASTTSSTIPKECLEWFEGCNSCGKVGVEDSPVCTEKFCDKPTKFNCTKWKENSEQLKPDDVQEHHDTERYLPRSPQISDE
jgi:PBP1b-binding outer membrane lipoprotein LpoB